VLTVVEATDKEQRVEMLEQLDGKVVHALGGRASWSCNATEVCSRC
jgi:hypothetical protein